ncbi:ribosomal protein, S18C [Nesidiocoris tenuis]|uniref:Ribosomal protein, S18C n=1 Tax=Nesidiocoris tenuis TaxID=355587 RepID=A0ABN7AYH9_9HEMI|nr:ribosomal protein, S18C [Nesidiocoris tenuis]
MFRGLVGRLAESARSAPDSVLSKIPLRSSLVVTRKHESSHGPQEDMPVDMENPYKKEKMSCILCQMKIDPDYKNVRLLSQFVSPYTGRIYGRHITGLCKNKQERVVKEIVKSQSAGFMPVTIKELEFMEDPKLYNPARPLRNHDY